jgi:hypothetical protein
MKLLIFQEQQLGSDDAEPCDDHQAHHSRKISFIRAMAGHCLQNPQTEYSESIAYIDSVIQEISNENVSMPATIREKSSSTSEI